MKTLLAVVRNIEHNIFFKLMLCHFPEFADGTLVVKVVS